MSKRTAKDEAIIDKAWALTEGAHRPLWGIEYHPGARLYGSQCAGCTYWTGYGTKTAVAKQIINHCEAMAGDPGLTPIEIAQAQIEGLRKDRKRIGGRGAARKKQAVDYRIRDLELEIARLTGSGDE